MGEAAMNIGDTAAAAQRVEDLYVSHHGEVRDFLYRLCRNTHLADDIASETFERALRHLTANPGDALHNPPAWLTQVAKNLLTDHYRRAAIRHEIATPNVAEGLEDVGATTLDDTVLGSETAAEIGVLMESLTPGQREVVVLRVVHGMNVKETATAMGRTPQAVRNLRHKAARRLAAMRDSNQVAAGE